MPHQILNMCYAHHRQTLVVFLYLKVPFVLRPNSTLHRKRISEESVNLFLHSTVVPIVALMYTVDYQVHSKQLAVFVKCPTSFYLIDFVMNDVVVDDPRGLLDVGIELSDDEKLCNRDYADDLVWLFVCAEDAEKDS